MIKIENLQKHFGPKHILNGVNLEFKDGEVTTIIGGSGTGKSTLIKCIVRLLEPDGGKIIVDGKDITNVPSSMRKMGIVFQNYALFENMTVLRNVEYALRKSAGTKKDYDRENAQKRAKEMLELVGLSEHLNKKPRQLSGGQQQRVAIARTLALNPDVILFDEPMSALDVDTRLSLRTELKELQKRFGNTMIYITHDQEEAFAMSDRIMVMDAGVIHQLDTPQNIIDHPADDYVRQFVIKNINTKINSLIQFARKEEKDTGKEEGRIQ